MADFEFKEDEQLVWVDAADIRRFPQLEHFYMIDSREYAEKLIKAKLVAYIPYDNHKIIRGYSENGNLFISSNGNLFVISKPKEYGKVFVYKKPIKSKLNVTD